MRVEHRGLVPDDHRLERPVQIRCRITLAATRGDARAEDSTGRLAKGMGCLVSASVFDAAQCVQPQLALMS